MTTSSPVTKFQQHPRENRTFARQCELPKLPVPPLEETCERYLKSLEGLQDPKDHEESKRAVEDFLKTDGPRIQERLKAWAENKDRSVMGLRTRLLSRLTRPFFITATSKISGETQP